jgi:hypothetical protein
MTEERPRHRPFQFSLRELMLWTAMLALFLGVLQPGNLDAASVAIPVCWAAAVVIARSMRGPIAALCVSALGGALLLSVIWVPLASVPRSFSAVDALLAGIVGTILGCWFFPIIEAAYRLVQWIDDFME